MDLREEELERAHVGYLRGGDLRERSCEGERGGWCRIGPKCVVNVGGESRVRRVRLWHGGEKCLILRFSK